MKPTMMMKSERSFTPDGITRSTDDGLIIFPLSSETGVKRYYWDYGELTEILDHDARSVDLDFLNSGNAPLLDSHNPHGLRNQIGCVKRAWLEDKRIYVEVSFSSRDDAQATKADVLAGIVRNVSIGYNIDKYEIDEDEKTLRATSWRPYEASFVPLPADESVGIGRSKFNSPKEGIMSDNMELPGLPTEEERAAQMTEAVNEIQSLSAEHNCSDVGRAFITGAIQRGETPSLAVFRGVVAASLPDGTPLVNTDIGMNERETQSFSITNLMRHMMDDGYTGASFEVEAVQAATAKRREAGMADSKHGGALLPTDLMRQWGSFTVDGVSTRTQTSRAALATSGNPNILTTDHMAGSFIDNLRNISAILGAGATMMEGLSSDVEIPGGDANIAANWLAAEDDNVAESNPTFRKVTLAPHDLGAYTDVTRRMLQQGTIAMEAYIRNQMLEAMRLAIDSAALYGSGLTGIPEGLANITGIGSVTFGAAIPTREEIIDLRTAIADTNRGTAGFKYLGNSSMVGDLQKTKVDAGSGIFLMNDSADRLVGNAFGETNQITDGDLFGGVWSDMLIGMWGGLELAMSDEAKFLSGGKRFRVIGTTDINVTRVGSFSLGNDGV